MSFPYKKNITRWGRLPQAAWPSLLSKRQYLIRVGARLVEAKGTDLALKILKEAQTATNLIEDSTYQVLQLLDVAENFIKIEAWNEVSNIIDNLERIEE